MAANLSTGITFDAPGSASPSLPTRHLHQVEVTTRAMFWSFRYRPPMTRKDAGTGPFSPGVAQRCSAASSARARDKPGGPAPAPSAAAIGWWTDPHHHSPGKPGGQLPDDG